ncbi:MAG: DUF1080 domain-containing protein [Ginsengibacter sp.]
MKSLLLLVIFISVIFFQSCHSNKLSSGRQNKNWISLFNGKDLTNWIPKIAGYKLGENFGNTFRVENGILSTRYNEYDSFNKRFGGLYYDKKFINYRLKVEYRFVGTLTPGAPSWGFRDGGIQYDCQPPATMGLDQPFPICLEYNLLGGNGKDERPNGEICASGMFVTINGKRNSSYCTQPLVKRTLAGDQWVTAEIDVRDGKITHFVNGEQVIQFENPRYDSANELVKKFVTNGDETVRDGYISLQSNSHPMDFRKIEIIEY